MSLTGPDSSLFKSSCSIQINLSKISFHHFTAVFQNFHWFPLPKRPKSLAPPQISQKSPFQISTFLVTLPRAAWMHRAHFEQTLCILWRVELCNRTVLRADPCSALTCPVSVGCCLPQARALHLRHRWITILISWGLMSKWVKLCIVDTWTW